MKISLIHRKNLISQVLFLLDIVKESVYIARNMKNEAISPNLI
jgi:hypothetical protein